MHPVTKYSPLYIAAYNGKKEVGVRSLQIASRASNAADPRRCARRRAQPLSQPLDDVSTRRPGSHFGPDRGRALAAEGRVELEAPPGKGQVGLREPQNGAEVRRAVAAEGDKFVLYSVRPSLSYVGLDDVALADPPACSK